MFLHVVLLTWGFFIMCQNFCFIQIIVIIFFARGEQLLLNIINIIKIVFKFQMVESQEFPSDIAAASSKRVERQGGIITLGSCVVVINR